MSLITVPNETRYHASLWHGGMMSPLYAVASSGQIHENDLLHLSGECGDCMILARNANDWESYDSLKTLRDWADKEMDDHIYEPIEGI